MGDRAIVFNELSLVQGVADPPSEEALDAFASLLLAIRMTSRTAYLVSPVQLWGAGVNAHSTLGPWAADARNRDKLRQIASMQNRAPIEDEFGVLDSASAEEYLWNDTPCVGLTYAYRLGLLAVSAPTRVDFDAPWLQLSRLWLSDDAGGTINTETVRTRHAALVTHLDMHRDWLALEGSSVLTGADVWAKRADLFGDLDFLGRVENDLLRLEGVALRAAYGRLRELQAATSEWNTEFSAEPSWRSRITPESASRVDGGHCDFRDDDGLMRTFSLHARYTPGAGRIHFALNRSEGRTLVAYVGSKRM